MPKFYVKTVVASTLLGIVLVLLAQNYVPLRAGLWLVLVLLTFIAINEKLTVGERWKLRHVLLFMFLAVLYMFAIFLL